MVATSLAPVDASAHSTAIVPAGGPDPADSAVSALFADPGPVIDHADAG